MLLNGVGMYAVIYLRKQSFFVPFQRQSAVLVTLETLIVFYDVQLEFRGESRREFERDVDVGERSAAVSPALCPDAYCMSRRYPSCGSEGEVVCSRFVFNSGEFDGIKLGVVYALPYP